MDIPLKSAVLCWHHGHDGETPIFQVRRRGDPQSGVDYRLSTGGAVYLEWRNGDDTWRKIALFGEIMSIMSRDLVPFDLIHKELLKIPEYRREVLAGDAPGAEVGFGDDE